jgi:hypothetical protein
MAETAIAAARRHVSEGEQRIASQRASIAKLRVIGASISLAEQLLIEMEISQSLFVTDLERIERELGV